ncbi:hypothetical protein BG910_08140 [Neisseria chenwenguii]|uniref:Uncharacterized protein n=1 Tax=Neisseria chenwenguii TaxID=1853278 RepID=A0A220S2J9_9NEIS|nr:hypothetical protein BG910_08140 [Neisseria chenwenguii]
MGLFRRLCFCSGVLLTIFPADFSLIRNSRHFAKSATTENCKKFLVFRLPKPYPQAYRLTFVST